MWSFPINSVVLISKLAVSRTSLTWFGSARDCHCWSYPTPQKFFGKSYTQGVLWKSIALQLVLCFDVKSLRRGTSARSSGRSSDPVQSVVPFWSLWKLSSPAMAKSLMNINELWSTALPIFFSRWTDSSPDSSDGQWECRPSRGVVGISEVEGTVGDQFGIYDTEDTQDSTWLHWFLWHSNLAGSCLWNLTAPEW